MDFKQYLPLVYQGLGEASFHQFLNALAQRMTSVEDGIQGVVDIPDVRHCPAELLVHHGNSKGWQIDQAWSEDFTRKLLEYLPYMYREKGTRRGIVNALRLMYECEVDIRDQDTSWILGLSRLGRDTNLGPTQGWEGQDVYLFRLYIGVVLDATTEAEIRTVVDYMKPPWTRYELCMGILGN